MLSTHSLARVKTTCKNLFSDDKKVVCYVNKAIWSRVTGEIILLKRDIAMTEPGKELKVAASALVK